MFYYYIDMVKLYALFFFKFINTFHSKNHFNIIIIYVFCLILSYIVVVEKQKYKLR
jgi:hypothetical protein